MPLIAKSRAAANDFMRLHTLDTDTSEKIGTRRFPIRGEFSFENVHFSYPSRPHVPVLRGLTLRVSPNECVALVGSSGSGKSTIAALLQRLHEPSAGAICMGENRLSEVDVNFLRYRLGLVSQTPSLIDASVHDNVSYGNRVISRTEVERACREAHIHEYIMSLPQGYETQLGENGSLLSGGQAQRLMIARAFARDPVICVFDESTSALDVTLQRQIIESIQHMKKVSIILYWRASLGLTPIPEEHSHIHHAQHRGHEGLRPYRVYRQRPCRRRRQVRPAHPA